MKWILTEPQFGDAIRVKSGSVYHYGVFISDDKIVQFGFNPQLRKTQEIAVCISNVEDFMLGEFIEVGVPEKKEKKRLRNKDDVVNFALSEVGKTGYNIALNNCEHFVYNCLFGQKVSYQVDKNLLSTVPFLQVYLAVMPDKKIKRLKNRERNQYIKTVSDLKTKKEKYFVWKLLEYAVKDTFDKKLNDFNVFKNSNGKWVCNSFEFSLSHSNGVLAVALSNKKVGVDVELIKEIKTPKIIDKIFNEDEKQQFLLLSDQMKDKFFTKVWTQKESTFKSLDLPAFFTANPKDFSLPTKSFDFSHLSNEYVVTVAGEYANLATLYLDINLA